MSTGLMVFDDENVKKTLRKQEQKCIYYPKDIPVNFNIKNIIGLVAERRGGAIRFFFSTPIFLISSEPF